MKTFLKTAAAAACLTFAIVPAASAMSILIDDFSTAQLVVDEPGFGIPNTSTMAVAALGGTRTLTVATSPSVGPNPFAGSRLESTGPNGLPSANSLRFANDPGQTGIATVTYNGGGGGLGDLTGPSGLLDRFLFADVTGDLLGTVFRATVSDGVTTGTYSENLGPGFSPFLLFSEAVFAGIDFTSIASLVFEFDSSAVPSFDGSLGSISVVPLPASLLLLLGGLGGLFGVSAVGRRRRDMA